MHVRHMEGGWKECKAGVFAVDHSDRTKGNGQKHMQEAPSEHQETFFTVRIAEHWHCLARLVVESSSLEIFKSQPGTVLASWVSVALHEQEGWTR